MKDWQFSTLLILLSTILAGVLYLVNAQVVRQKTSGERIQQAVEAGVTKALQSYDVTNE